MLKQRIIRMFGVPNCRFQCPNVMDVRYKFQKDQSYDLSITSEESSNLEFHVGKETLICT